MNIIEIIKKKRDHHKLNEQEIEFFVSEYSKNTIPDYQVSSLLMAIYLNGMDEDETYYLTKSIINSGKTIDLSSIKGTKVDKHSTGGVGDKTTLVLLPLLSSIGLSVAKMSGRGLGHTGGTIDKLESIPSFKVEKSIDDFIKQVGEIGCGLISQSSEIALADKKLYSLRDVSGSVESIPLIASSIMAKKIALGSDIICLDVKVGNGAFFKNPSAAKKAAKLMIRIGKRFSRKVKVVLSRMEEPLGNAIGNKIEVIEAIKALNGEGPNDLKEVVLTLAYTIAKEAKLIENDKKLLPMLENKLLNKEAYQKFLEFVKAQEGDLSNFSLKYVKQDVKVKKQGYISKIDAYALGNLLIKLGGGRITKEDSIDYDAGIYLHHKIGDLINNDSVVFSVYSKERLTDEFITKLLETVSVTNKKVKKKKEIIKII